jgi:hypothetical protein
VPDRFDLIPTFHKYSIDHIHLFLLFILSGRTSLRGASRVFEIISSFFGLSQCSPSWYSGRLWLLRIGYFKLHRQKQIADDWIWIVDHTIQLGNEKCLVILGIRQSCLPPAELYINHEDVEPIALLPVNKSNGDIVYQQLEKTIYRQCHNDLSEELIDTHLKSDKASRVRDELIAFVEQLSLNTRQGERLLGSSEIIESVIGKFKSFEQDQSKSGFTAMLLSLASMLSKTTQDVIRNAIETVPTKKVFEWIRENIGQSVQSKKKEIAAFVKSAEQKPDQVLTMNEG